MTLANNNIYYRAPFHCSLMQEAANAMEEALKKVEIKKPIVDIVSNVTAKPVGAFTPFFIIIPSPIGCLLYVIFHYSIVILKRLPVY